MTYFVLVTTNWSKCVCSCPLCHCLVISCNYSTDPMWNSFAHLTTEICLRSSLQNCLSSVRFRYHEDHFENLSTGEFSVGLWTLS